MKRKWGKDYKSVFQVNLWLKSPARCVGSLLSSGIISFYLWHPPPITPAQCLVQRAAQSLSVALNQLHFWPHTLSPMIHTWPLSFSFDPVRAFYLFNVSHRPNNLAGKKLRPLRIKITGKYWTSLHRGKVPSHILGGRPCYEFWPRTLGSSVGFIPRIYQLPSPA